MANRTLNFIACGLSLCALTLGSTANAQSDSASNTAADGQTLPEGVVAMVNGRPVPALSLDNVMRQLKTNGQAASAEDVLTELINMELLTQEAEKLNIDKQADVAASLQLQYIQTMANAFLAHQSKSIQLTEDELRAEYEKQVAGIDSEEYRASHILLETQDEADKVLAELAEGGDFASLAKEYSIDPAGENGGDLGWFQAGAMVAEFSAAVAAMEVGTTSTEPVKTDFGFHIIKLLETRKGALPDYESVKPGLTNMATRSKLANLVDGLKDNADILR